MKIGKNQEQRYVQYKVLREKIARVYKKIILTTQKIVGIQQQIKKEEENKEIQDIRDSISKM